MNTQHTPGPWGNFDARIYAGEHGDTKNPPSIVGEAFVMNDRIGSSVARANARLMAAAPDLLAALKSLMAVWPEGESCMEAASQAFDSAYAAIAKAEAA